MGFWIELHCDCPPELKPDSEEIQPDKLYFPERRCYSDRGINFAMMAKNLSSAKHVLNFVTNSATNDGWVYNKRKRWRCPSCVKWSKEQRKN